MAWTLARLKLKLLVRGITAGGTRSIVGTVLTFLMVGVFGVLGGITTATLRTAAHDDAALVLGAVYLAFFLGWTLGPITTLASDGTIDPAQLALFPLQPRQLMPGLIGARLIGPGGLFTVLIAAGGVVALGRDSVALLAALGGALLAIAMFVAGSGAMAAALAAATQKRRLRDVALLASPVFALLVNVGIRMFDGRVGEGSALQLRAAARTISLLPPAWPARAVGSLEAGQPAAALALLASSIVVIVALLSVWRRMLQRALVEVSEAGPAKATRRRILLPGLDRWSDPRRAAVASKDLRMMFREPRQRAALLGVSAPLLIALYNAASSRGADGNGAAFVALFALFPLATQASNLFGFDGPAFWLHAAAGEDLEADLWAKGAARFVLSMALVSGLGLLVAGLSGDWGHLPAVVALAFAGGGVLLGVGSWISVNSPIPLVDRDDPFSTGNSGRNSGTFFATLIMLGLPAAVVAPFMLLAYLARGAPVVQTVFMLTAMGVGALAWRAGVGKAVAANAGRDPDLLGLLTASAAD